MDLQIGTPILYKKKAKLIKKKGIKIVSYEARDVVPAESAAHLDRLFVCVVWLLLLSTEQGCRTEY
jgi:hypothetical protein